MLVPALSSAPTNVAGAGAASLAGASPQAAAHGLAPLTGVSVFSNPPKSSSGGGGVHPPAPTPAPTDTPPTTPSRVATRAANSAGSSNAAGPIPALILPGLPPVTVSTAPGLTRTLKVTGLSSTAVLANLGPTLGPIAKTGVANASVAGRGTSPTSSLSSLKSTSAAPTPPPLLPLLLLLQTQLALEY